jgi:hypothetical protein
MTIFITNEVKPFIEFWFKASLSKNLLLTLILAPSIVKKNMAIVNIDNPPIYIKKANIILPNNDKSVATVTVDNPVTHTALVDSNSASIKPIDLPFPPETGKTKKNVPVSITARNVNIIIRYGCIFLVFIGIHLY